MELLEAKQILNTNGYVLVESAIKGDYIRGEHGGEPYFDLPNEYSYSDAKRIFIEAIYGPNKDVEKYWNQLNSKRKQQFEKTYEQFERYKSGEPIKLYRGLVLNVDKELDLNKPGECWTFNKRKAITWAEDIWDNMVFKHVMNKSNLEYCNKFIMIGETTLKNCRLPYSLWLAGRFERPEWEVRIKDESKIKIVKKVLV